MSGVNQKDLVLTPSPHVNPDKWDEAKYHAFADELCRGRTYQQEAIFAALRFLLGGNYQNLRDLAKKNYNANPKLREFYRSWEAMELRLQFPDMLSCSLDLATGTGKSYVLYGIAAIMLAEGAASRVLLICPSLTIESGLTEKFRRLAADDNLRALMPETPAFAPPRIIDAHQTVEDGCICVENYHAILKHVKSSIHDSFVGRGGDALVLNDEAHHVASESRNKFGKWKEFLMNPDYGFRRMVGVSGTCYVGNQYFTDVVSRYSLRQAVEEKVVKRVEYVIKQPRQNSTDAKWQLIHQNHEENRRTLKSRGIRPLSIIITKNINRCDSIAEELRAFLRKQDGISNEKAEKRVITVTSHQRHRGGVLRLKSVDSPQNETEWIVSVSMLTEGWDVKNVFQVVPHEERAFNSKLLIAQVLGRGLRVPDKWDGNQPTVTVFNHEAWASRIQHLVDAILELEQRVSSVVIPDSDIHFELHNLEYSRRAEETAFAMTGEYNLFEKGIFLPTVTVIEPGVIVYEDVSGRRREQPVTIRHQPYTVAEVAEDMWRKLRALDLETEAQDDPQRRTNYAEKYPLSRLEEVVREAVKRAGIDENAVPDMARQQCLQALNVVWRRESKRVTYTTTPEKILTINTGTRQDESCSAAELQSAKTIFCRSDCADYLPQEQREFFAELEDPDGEFSGKVVKVENDFFLKSPVNMVIADHNPERKFIRQLCSKDNASQIFGWIKNPNMGFYSIEYAWGTGHRSGRTSHTRRGRFSPDFFIKMQDGRVLVVEIKDDSELDHPSRENIGKHKFASEHFDTLNEWLKKEGYTVRYQFNMLTPRNYDMFFASWKKLYCSELDAAILRENGVDDD